MEPQKTLREYQLVDLAFAMARDKSANLSDPGTGKTPPVCVYLYWLWAYEKTRSFWVMPKSLLRKNRKELLEFTTFKPEDVLIYDGTPAQRAKLREKSDAKVWLMGFRRFADEWHTLMKLHPDFNALAVDEIHLGFGGHTSQQTQSFYSAMRRIRRFVAMTGTLINGRLDTAYPTIHVIEPRYYASHEHFLLTHAVKDLDGRIVAWRNHDRLAQILGNVAIRRAFVDVYGKNEIVTQLEDVPMARRQAEVYKQWEEQALIELDDRFVDAANQGVAQLRARQILAHPECVRLPTKYDPKTGKAVEYQDFDLVGSELTGKDDRLLIHLADHKNAGTPLIIFGVFELELERTAELCRKQGLRVGVIHGGVPEKRRAEIDILFQSGELDVVVGSFKTCGVGFNWGHVDHIVCLDLDYQDAAYLQARRRAERGTRDRPLRVTILKYEDAKVEDRVISIVERKSRDANLVDETNEQIVLSNKTQKKTGARKAPVPQPAKSAKPGVWQFL